MISRCLVLHTGEAHDFNEIVSKRLAIIGDEWGICGADKKNRKDSREESLPVMWSEWNDWDCVAAGMMLWTIFLGDLWRQLFVVLYLAALSPPHVLSLHSAKTLSVSIAMPMFRHLIYSSMSLSLYNILYSCWVSNNCD